MSDTQQIISPSPPAKQIASFQNRRELENACAEIEALFLHQLLKVMRAAIPKTDLFHGGRAEDLYVGMRDGYVAREMAAKGGIGLGRILMEQLAANQDLFDRE